MSQNQYVVPSPGASGTFQPLSPQPVSFPFATGVPPEGNKSAIVLLTVPAGVLTASLSVNLSQFAMSMVQALLVDNQANSVAVTIKAGQGVTFGIQPNGTQMIPVFQQGTLLNILATLASVQTVATIILLQIFNTPQPPATWLSSLTVGGNVAIATVAGNVNVSVSGANILGVSIQASTTGGAQAIVISSLSTMVTRIKTAAGTATLKGFAVASTSNGWLQLFDVPNPTSVTLGTTAPTVSIPCFAAGSGQGQNTLGMGPPEGLAFLTGISAAWTTLINNNVAPANALSGTFFYA